VSEWVKGMQLAGMVLTGAEANIINTTPPLHPSIVSLLRYFEYAHLPEHLQWISRPFHDLAHDAAHNWNLDGAELTAGLRKLLEAKDCLVRAAL
jgi:hypothetical protein